MKQVMTGLRWRGARARRLGGPALAQESEFGPADAEETYYWVSNKANLPLFVQYDYVGMKKIAEELGVQVVVAGPTDFDIPGFIAAVEQVCAQKPAGVSVRRRLGPVADRAGQASASRWACRPWSTTATCPIPSASPISAPTGPQVGVAQAKKMMEVLPDGGKIAMMSIINAGNMREARGGLHAYIEANGGGKYEIVANEDDKGDAQRPPQVTAALLAAHPDIAGFAGFDSESGAGIVTRAARGRQAAGRHQGHGDGADARLLQDRQGGLGRRHRGAEPRALHLLRGEDAARLQPQRAEDRRASAAPTAAGRSPTASTPACSLVDQGQCRPGADRARRQLTPPARPAAARRPALVAFMQERRMARIATTRIRFLGVAAYEIVTRDGLRILLDPVPRREPRQPGASSTSFDRVDLVVVSHAAFDHLGDTDKIAARYGCPVVCGGEVKAYLTAKGIPAEQIRATTWGIRVEVAGIESSRSSATTGRRSGCRDGTFASGVPMAFIVYADEDVRFYHYGDTALFSDMKLQAELYRPTIGCIGIANPQEILHRQPDAGRDADRRDEPARGRARRRNGSGSRPCCPATTSTPRRSGRGGVSAAAPGEARARGEPVADALVLQAGRLDRARRRRPASAARRRRRPMQRRSLRCARRDPARGARAAASRGPGEALVAVRAAGLCAGDLYIYPGKNPYVTYPRVGGHEIAGDGGRARPGHGRARARRRRWWSSRSSAAAAAIPAGSASRIAAPTSGSSASTATAASPTTSSRPSSKLHRGARRAVALRGELRRAGRDRRAGLPARRDRRRRPGARSSAPARSGWR